MMKLRIGRRVVGLASVVAVLVAACSSKTDASKADAGADDSANESPHALGTILLGETHDSASSQPVPSISATFIPDSASKHECTKKIGTCEIAEAPKCQTGANPGCGDGEVCVFDKDCTARCQKVPYCSLQCLENEVCTNDNTGKGTCTKVETFDAGPLAFAGTTTAITLFPPYAYEGESKGAPFLAGAELKVQGQGAVGAGFEAFEETFTATTFIQSTPKLNTISSDDLFGSLPVTISWIPGKDSIIVTLTGGRGVVTCKGNDPDGKLDIPREAIEAARGNDGALSLSLARQRKETRKGKKTKGQLSSATIQPEGWLDLVTRSTETASFRSCDEGYGACGTTCVPVAFDSNNCGACGKACSQGTVCRKGACVANACRQCITTKCKAAWDVCSADAQCKLFEDCIFRCDYGPTSTDCVQPCIDNYPVDYDKSDPVELCKSDNTCNKECLSNQ